MIQKRMLITGVLITLLLGIVPVLSVAAPAPEQSAQPVQQEGELLRNPGFEGITCKPGSEPPECLDNWTHDVHWPDEPIHDNIYTPQGWITWWRRGGDYGQPEVKTIPSVPPFTGALPRIRSGYYAVLMFTYSRLQDMGLYQCVSGLQAGATVQFSAHAHGWSCDDKGAPLGYSCSDPWNQRFQVGIEPNGYADPFASSIVWSEETTAPDHYKLIGPTSAQVGEGGSVCVFLRSKTKWMFVYQDAYWDDTSLVYTSPPAEPTSAAPPPPAAPAGPPPTAMPLPTAQPDGSIVYTVQSGDTLFGISLKFGVPLDQIRQLNAGSLGGNDIIRPGQQLVIALPSETPVPTALPEPTPAEAAEGGGDASTGEQPAIGEGATTGVSICVLAFHDRDGNTLRGDPAVEELLPNTKFLLADATGLINQYTTDGMQEPYCFTGLAAGSYRVIQQPPAGYTPSDQTEQTVAVAEGTSVEVPFGYVRDEDAALAGNSADSAAGADGSSGWLRSAFSTLFKVGGVLVLLMCAGGVVLFILNQRRMNI